MKINALATSLIVFMAMLTAFWYFSMEESRREELLCRPTRSRRNTTSAAITTSIAAGIVVGLINYVIPLCTGKLASLAPLCLIVMFGFMAYLAKWWKDEGSHWNEALVFIVLAVVSYFVAKAAAVMTAALILSDFLKSLVLALPAIALVAFVGFIITDIFWFRYKESTDTEANKSGDKAAAVVVGAIAAFLILFIMLTLVNWSEVKAAVTGAARGLSLTAEKADDVEVVDDTNNVEDDEGVIELAAVDPEVDDVYPVDVEPSWYRFYHYDLLKDDNIEDDFNFGPSAYKKDIKAKEVMKEHFKRVEADPALGCATFAAFDVRLGTDFMIPGEHYDQNWSDGYWTTKINERIQYFMANEEAYDVAVERWEAFVEKYAKVSLTYNKDIKDQMYMVSLTTLSELEAPEVIIAKTDQPTGHILTYVFLIKGNEFKVPFRTECGYQPTDVAEPMKEEPLENPIEQQTKKPKPKPEPTPKPKPDDGGNGDDPKKPKKDPSKSPKTNTEPNDDPGPGPDTNNGEGSKTSKEDKPDNSNHMSKEDYDKSVKELKDTNETQKTGSDNNKPSTPTPKDTTVDNNGDKGTGNGGINQPTPKQEKAKEADTGKTINEKPGEAWGGPPD